MNGEMELPVRGAAGRRRHKSRGKAMDELVQAVQLALPIWASAGEDMVRLGGFTDGSGSAHVPEVDR